jgi:hypothetical protein
MNQAATGRDSTVARLIVADDHAVIRAGCIVASRTSWQDVVLRLA